VGTTDFSRALRVLFGALGALVCLSGIGIMLAGEEPGGFAVFLAGALALVVVLYEQERYRARGSERGRMQRTDEVFDDPTTGERMRVWFDPATGERRYIPDP
jgi:hypothetical protein